MQVGHIYSGPLDEDDDDLTQAMTTCDPEVLSLYVTVCHCMLLYVTVS